MISTSRNYSQPQDSVRVTVRRHMGGGVWRNLVHSFGGSDIKVPALVSTLSPEHFLVRALGIRVHFPPFFL